MLRRGKYEGPEPERLAVLKLAALSGAPYVDVEFKAAPYFFAGGWVLRARARGHVARGIRAQQTPSPAGDGPTTQCTKF